MSLSFYVLAEKYGVAIQQRTGQSEDLVLLMAARHPTYGDRPAIFWSPIDAAICLEYLNLREHEGEPNHYEVRMASDPGVVTAIQAEAAFGRLPTLIYGFSTDELGKLVVTGGADSCYRLAQVPFSKHDFDWIFENKSTPNQNMLTSVLQILERYQAADHQDEINKLDLMKPGEIRTIAKIALVQKGFVLANPQSKFEGLSVYSAARQAWRKLA